MVHAADVQDRDGGILLMSTLFGLFPFLLKLYGDGGYQGSKFRQGMKRVCEQINVGIVKRSDAGTKRPCVPMLGIRSPDVRSFVRTTNDLR